VPGFTYFVQTADLQARVKFLHSVMAEMVQGDFILAGFIPDPHSKDKFRSKTTSQEFELISFCSQ
jgi:hypothetical protein